MCIFWTYPRIRNNVKSEQLVGWPECRFQIRKAHLWQQAKDLSNSIDIIHAPIIMDIHFPYPVHPEQKNATTHCVFLCFKKYAPIVRYSIPWFLYYYYYYYYYYHYYYYYLFICLSYTTAIEILC